MTEQEQTHRTPLSKARVLRAAIAFADEHGVDALSMRKLAAELGFGVMSLYNHVAGKDEMLTEMVDLLAEQITTPPSSADWKSALRASAVSAHELLAMHPWAAGLWSSGWPGAGRLRHWETLLRCLNDAGFSEELVYSGFHAVNMHIGGSALRELNLGFDDEDLDELAQKFFREVPADRYPHLTQHARAHQDEAAHADDFVFVLDLILNGLEQAHTNQ